MTENHDTNHNIEVSQQTFENVPESVRPVWAGLILSRFEGYINEIPNPVKELYGIIDDRNRWQEAHEQFTKIRLFGLNNETFQPGSYLRLAELVAKVTYNASKPLSPFDSNSGHFIPAIAIETAKYFNDSDIDEDVKSAIHIFSRNKKLKSEIKAAKDFLLYQKIDKILWSNWDPIGINDIAPRDEYESYVPKIYRLVKSNVSRDELAERLFRFETEDMGLYGNFEKCLIIADKILKYL